MNINSHVIGQCSKCGGQVSIPLTFHSVKRPPASCEKCGATAQYRNLPVIPMKGATK